MNTVLEFVAILAILVGTFFSLVGVIGLVRFPDAYARLHATGKVGVFGTVLLLIAAIIWTPLGWGRGLLLIALLLITGPVAAHAIASAAYRLGLPMQRPIVDELASLEARPDGEADSQSLNPQ